MSELFLSRARLRRDAPIASLASLLVPSDPNERTGASHKLAWSLFNTGPDQQRDFLWPLALVANKEGPAAMSDDTQRVLTADLKLVLRNTEKASRDAQAALERAQP